MPLAITIWWHDTHTRKGRAAPLLMLTSLLQIYKPTWTTKPAKAYNQQWALLKSSKCHKQGQYKIMSHATLQCTTIWLNADVLTMERINLVLRILRAYWGHLAPAMRIHVSLPIYYDIILCVYPAMYKLLSPISNLCNFYYSLLYYFLDSFNNNVYTNYDFYSMWT